MMHFMKKLLFSVFALLALSISYGTTALAQQPQQQQAASKTATTSSSASPVDVNKIIRAFSAKETEFRRALNLYAFKREAVIQVIGMGGQIAGEYHRVSNFTFDDSGRRYEKIVYFPMPTFGGVTPEDLEDLSGVNPFALEAAKLDQYNFTYVGKERIDELDLYVFDVAPKVAPNPKKSIERFFIGRIWVDDRDLQIVKSRGKGIPETKDNKFPVVETYREQIDGRYWFPTYSYADEQLVYDNGTVMHIRMRVKYSDFKQGHAEVRIIDPEGNELEDAPKQPDNTPTTTTQPKAPIRGGMLNDSALELPAPVYPAEAKQAGISGIVKVRVTVDEEGKVISAEAIDGPKQLREAAVAAAKKARFEPTRLHGAAIKIEGILTYNFVK
jgi:TonB family protein